MKRQIALILSVLLCILSACGGMGTDAPELDLPEADVIESEPVAALGEYSLTVTQTELPGGLASLASACAAENGVYLAGAGADGAPMLGIWADGVYEPLDLSDGITEIESVFFGDALSVLARAGDAIQILHYEDSGVLTTELNGDLSALGKDLYYAEFGGMAYVMDSNTIAEVKDGNSRAAWRQKRLICSLLRCRQRKMGYILSSSAASTSQRSY